jgi:hypothetical protein
MLVSVRESDSLSSTTKILMAIAAGGERGDGAMEHKCPGLGPILAHSERRLVEGLDFYSLLIFNLNK